MMVVKLVVELQNSRQLECCFFNTCVLVTDDSLQHNNRGGIYRHDE